MREEVSYSASFWRQVRWCDQQLLPFQRRVLMQAWLPAVIGERAPWHPVTQTLATSALELARAPYRLLEFAPGSREAFRPTMLGEMVIWFHLMGTQPEVLRPGLQMLPLIDSAPLAASGTTGARHQVDCVSRRRRRR